MTYLLFDQGLGNKLMCANDADQLRQNISDFIVQEFDSRGREYGVMGTPFSFFENLGLKHKNNNLPKPPHVVAPSNLKTHEQVEWILDHARSHYSKQNALTLANLTARAEQQKKYVLPNAFSERIFDQCVMRFCGNEWWRNLLINYLAIEFAQHESLYEKPFDVMFCIIKEVLRQRSEGLNMSAARAFQAHFERIKTGILARHDITEEQRRVVEERNLPRLDSYEDMLDSDVIHYSVMGLIEPDPIPVMAFTLDPNPDEAETRMWWTKLGYGMAIAALKQTNEFPLVDEVDGEVIFFDRQTQAFKKRLRSSDLPRAVDVPEL